MAKPISARSSVWRRIEVRRHLGLREKRRQCRRVGEMHFAQAHIVLGKYR
jgi:hypothetical protein